MTPPLRLEPVDPQVTEVDRLKAITIKHLARRQGQSDMPTFPLDEPPAAA